MAARRIGSSSRTRRLGGEAGSRRGLGQREMAMTQGKMPFVFSMVVLATLLIGAPAAHAAWREGASIGEKSIKSRGIVREGSISLVWLAGLQWSLLR
jgi:hypothetical protein